MLKIPELQPNQEPFNPEVDYSHQSNVQTGNHILTLPQEDMDSVIPFGGASPTAKAILQDEEDGVTVGILDNTLVKEAITSLHCEDDVENKKLLAYEHSRICDIVTDYEKFIAAQKKKFFNLLKNNNQRHYFTQATEVYFAQARTRAHALRDARIRHFQAETINRQNEEFLSRALRPENIMNDVLQTCYRDMILHNLELLMADTPTKECQEVLDSACKNFYTKIMDKRLAIDPSSLKPMLAASAIRRVFSRNELDDYRKAIKTSAKHEELSGVALTWVHNGISHNDATNMANERYPDTHDREQVIDFYTRFRYSADQKRSLRAILDLDNAWRQIVAAEYDFAAIPDWVKNGDPELYSFMVAMLDARETSGGLPREPKLTALCRFIQNFSPATTAKSLSERKTLYTLIEDLGGPDSEAFQAILRLLIGKTTPADRNWFDALNYARFVFSQLCGENALAEKEESFLSMFDRARHIKLERDSHNELDPLEINDLAIKCFALFK